MIILAGASGNLGGRIAAHLKDRGAPVKPLSRRDFETPLALREACSGGSVIVSALSGLRPVIVDLQRRLAAQDVPRFIASDYCIDFKNLPSGFNRNLDVRRDFHQLVTRPVTSVFNGAFMDLLTGQAPILLFKLRRVLFWGDPDQEFDLTAVDDVAWFTAAAALDPSPPSTLRISGERTSPRKLAALTGFKLLRAGSLGALERTIKITRAVMPESDALYPPWQGMQYLHNMYSGFGKVDPIDNDRYGPRSWTTIADTVTRRAVPPSPPA